MGLPSFSSNRKNRKTIVTFDALALDSLSHHAFDAVTDTVRTIEGYADLIVLRHFQAGSSKTAASVASIPIINAGDGPGQHPTQVHRSYHTELFSSSCSCAVGEEVVLCPEQHVSGLSIMGGCMQALLDVYTIQREIGRLDNLRIGLVGDLANGRTVRSLAYLLSMYEGIKFYFVAPDVVRMQARLRSPRCPHRTCRS